MKDTKSANGSRIKLARIAAKLVEQQDMRAERPYGTGREVAGIITMSNKHMYIYIYIYKLAPPTMITIFARLEHWRCQAQTALIH